VKAAAPISPAETTNPVIKALAAAYRASQAGTTGQTTRAFSIRYEKLVHDRAQADVRTERTAREVLLRLESAGILRLTRKPLAREKILSVFLQPGSEAEFFALLHEAPPAQQRDAAIAQLTAYLTALSNHPHTTAWTTALREGIQDITDGRLPEGLPANRLARDEVLRATAAILTNTAPILLRRFSAEKLNNSKLIGERREAIERFMAQFLSPELCSLEAWQVIESPPMVQFRGPLGVATAAGLVAGENSPGSPYTVTDEVLRQAARVTTTASRCLSIENHTTFLEMAIAHPEDLLIHTSYPSSSVIRLLQLLPAHLPLFHWGDTDPWGYDILRVLRLKTGRAIGAHRMHYRPANDGKPLSRRETTILTRLLNDPVIDDMRPELLAIQSAGNKGKFEQESLPIS
jgi:hypothetical protein